MNREEHGMLMATHEQAPPPDGGVVILEWLTDRQYETLAVIHQYLLSERRYPTASEIAQRLTPHQGKKISVQRTRELIEALIEKRYAEKGRGHRTLRLTEEAFEKLRRDAEGAQKTLPGI